MSFSDNLKAAREAKCLTQTELAELVGVSQAAIAQHESALKVPTVITAVKLASVLNTTCEELVNGSPTEPEEQQKGIA